MKKLVTIISAVMMLLILAACAPTYSADAEQNAAIADANNAIAILAQYATEEGTSKDNGYTVTVDEEIVYDLKSTTGLTISGNEITVGAGSEYTSSSVTSGDTVTTTVTVAGTVTWKELDPADETEKATITKTCEVEYTGTVTVTTPSTGKPSTTFQAGPFRINGVAYEPMTCNALKNFIGE